jgi:hypothetical protein
MFLLFMTICFTFVSMKDVLENIPKDSLVSAFNFFVSAIKNTTWIIQALIAGFLVRVSVASSLSVYRNAKNLRFKWWSSKLGLSSNAEKSPL